MPHIWASVEGFCTTSEGLEAFLNIGLIFRLLGSIMGLAGYKNTFQNRTAAATILSKCLWNPVKGADASDILRRFLPEPLVVQLKKKSGPAVLKVFDDVVENPEIVWTAEMQGELRRSLISLTVEKAGFDTFQLVPVLTPEFVVKYRQLDDELYLGNVYLRLFLKQASFRLSNTIYFLEKLVRNFIS
jgi:DnaJ family protein C protein 13